MSKSVTALTLFLTVVCASGNVPAAELQVLHEGGSVAANVVVRFDPPRNGRFQQLWRVPLEALVPGDYTWRVTVTDGALRQVREARVRITE